MFALSLLALPLVVHSCDTTEALNKDIATPFNSHNGLGSILKSVDDLQNSRFNLFLDPNTTTIEHVLTFYSLIRSIFFIVISFIVIG